MGKWRYGVILDAGSSGTRLHIYRWLNNSRARHDARPQELESLPAIETKKSWTKKIHPGVSTFGDSPHRVGPEHLQELLDHAVNQIPKEEHANTPIFLLATAGMRLLRDRQRKELLDHICTYARNNTSFELPDCDLHIQVIPGETEGLYGWIAANYLLGGFDAPEKHDHGKGHHTYGFLDMGGASAQIAFAPNATEAEKHADDLKLLRMRTIDGMPMEYKVFVTTWLGFGVNEARKRYVQALLDQTGTPGANRLPDPCLPSGLVASSKGGVVPPVPEGSIDGDVQLLGTGKFDECLRRTYPLLDKDRPCTDPPCLLHGVHVPAIDFDINHFVGVSEYWHTTHEVFEMSHKEKAYDFHTYQDRVNEFCSQDWKSIQEGVSKKKWGKQVDEETAVEVCFKASWIINMLHDGIGIPRVGLEKTPGHDGNSKPHNGTKEILDHAKEKGFLDAFQAVNKIDGTEVSWTLGKMVLYASSQIPPADHSLAVGFGTNKATFEPGELPTDFQYAGGIPAPLPNDLTDEDDWTKGLLHNSSRRIPGLVFILSILILIGVLLCGKDRRTSVLHKVLHPFSPRSPSPRSSKNLKSRRSFRGKLFGLGKSKQQYERILENGASSDGEPSDLELADYDGFGRATNADLAQESPFQRTSEDSYDSTRVGKTSGWATPAMRTVTPAFTPCVGVDNRNSGYFGEMINGGQVGLGLAGLMSSPHRNAIDREGLLARVESRERMKGMDSIAEDGGGRGGRSGYTTPGLTTPGLFALHARGSNSRTGSPVRGLGRSPVMTPLKENID